MLTCAEALWGRGAGPAVLNLGGGDVDTATPIWSMVFIVMVTPAQRELEIQQERITDSVAKRRATGRTSAGGAQPPRTPRSTTRSTSSMEDRPPATRAYPGPPSTGASRSCQKAPYESHSVHVYTGFMGGYWVGWVNRPGLGPTGVVGVLGGCRWLRGWHGRCRSSTPGPRPWYPGRQPATTAARSRPVRPGGRAGSEGSRCR
nr:hypothetical protein [Kocuria sediminis]